MTPAIEDDGFITVHPSPAATAHDASSEATADALILARAVVADLTQYEDAKVIAAARVIAQHSPMQTERGEAEELIFLMEDTQ